MKKNVIVLVFLCTFFGILNFTTLYRLEKVEKKLNIIQTEKVDNQKESKTDEQIEEDNQSKTEYNTIDDYLQMIFPTDGNYYVEETGKVKFYSDPACTKEIDNPRFISKSFEYIPRFQLDSGYKISIYVYLMEDEKVCYTPSNIIPNFIKEK